MDFTRFIRFRPDPEAEPTRKPAVKVPVVDHVEPTVDERTAEAALQILENGAFDKVFTRLRAGYVEEMVSADPSTAEGERTLRSHAFAIRILDDMKNRISSMADELKIHRSGSRAPLTRKKEEIN